MSEDVFETYFQCNLTACKGACCVAGDFGAPIDPGEETTIELLLDKIKPYIDDEGLEAIKKHGIAQTYEDDDRQFRGTTLREDGACAFLKTNELGIAYCGIESAYRDKAIDFKKPISCELYPLRITEIPEHNYTAINYDRWEVCNPACAKGKHEGIKLYEFLEEAITRRFGQSFYKELVNGAEHYDKNNK